MKKVFIHLINGFPAEYEKGLQICYASRSRGIKTVCFLSQIKKDQRASVKWRKKKGFDPRIEDYDYMRVIV